MDYNERVIEKEGFQTRKYFEVFNTCCKLAFFTAITKLQNYNNSIISMATFDFFVDLASKCMPRLWGQMCSQRNVDGRPGNKNNTLNIIRKQCQVLLQIFTLCKMRNPKMLVWWAMIQVVVFYGCGVGRTALDATHFGALHVAPGCMIGYWGF